MKKEPMDYMFYPFCFVIDKAEEKLKTDNIAFEIMLIIIMSPCILIWWLIAGLPLMIWQIIKMIKEGI